MPDERTLAQYDSAQQAMLDVIALGLREAGRDDRDDDDRIVIRDLLSASRALLESSAAMLLDPRYSQP